MFLVSGGTEAFEIAASIAYWYQDRTDGASLGDVVQLSVGDRRTMECPNLLSTQQTIRYTGNDWVHLIGIGRSYTGWIAMTVLWGKRQRIAVCAYVERTRETGSRRNCQLRFVQPMKRNDRYHVEASPWLLLGGMEACS